MPNHPFTIHVIWRNLWVLAISVVGPALKNGKAQLFMLGVLLVWLHFHCVRFAACIASPQSKLGTFVSDGLGLKQHAFSVAIPFG